MILEILIPQKFCRDKKNKSSTDVPTSNKYEEFGEPRWIYWNFEQLHVRWKFMGLIKSIDIVTMHIEQKLKDL